MKRLVNIQVAVFFALWFGLLAMGPSALFQDPGTFWHTVVGEEIVARGQPVRSDSFTFTFDGRPWLALQWLGEVAMGAMHRLGGLDALLLLAATVIAATYAWLAGRLVRCGLHWLVVIAVVFVVLAASAHHFHVRPHLATIALAGVSFALLCDVESGRAPVRRLFWLLPLFVLWTNIHGGVLGGLATLWLVGLGWLSVWFWKRRRAGTRLHSPLESAADARQLAVVLAAAPVAMLVNPYGLEMVSAWWNILTMPLPDLIEEHRPLDFARPEGITVLLLGVVYCVVLVDAWRQERRVTFLLPLVWLVLAFTRVRHAPLFAILAGLSIAEMLPHTRLAAWLAKRGDLFTLLPPFRRGGTGGLNPLPPCGGGLGWGVEAGEAPDVSRPGANDTASASDRRDPHLAARLFPLLPTLAVLIALKLQIVGATVPVVGRGWVKLDERKWPADLVPELTRLGESGNTRIFNSLDFGGFVVYSAPGLATFIDDRCELFGADFLSAYAQAEREKPEMIDRWADEYGFRAALVRADSSFDLHLSSSAGWKVVRRGRSAALFAHPGAAPPTSPPATRFIRRQPAEP
ncbi:MAG: hypothetical protein HYS13_09455 [Planctomycetia bacterium]|nr:hypothetical protein [Planctomycetia bacterium]